MAWKRIKEAMALLLIGDGIISVLEPRRHTKLWGTGPKPYQVVMRRLNRKPVMAQAIGLVLIGAGLWIASRQKS